MACRRAQLERQVQPNDTSIGSEIVNSGYTNDMREQCVWDLYNEKQIIAVALLAKESLPDRA